MPFTDPQFGLEFLIAWTSLAMAEEVSATGLVRVKGRAASVRMGRSMLEICMLRGLEVVGDCLLGAELQKKNDVDENVLLSCRNSGLGW